MDGFIPQTIVDQPIPLLGGGYSQPSGTNTNPVSNSDAEAPLTNVDQKFPVAIIAVDTVSTSLNTETKAILGSFTFEQLGAIKIGSYVNGLSGELDISPNGISATNVNGDTTFTLDGTTGDAAFAGTINTGSLIAGVVNVGGNNILIDGANERIVMNDGSNNRLLIGNDA